jgi:uncharacterized coiled-coil DUF342 family protein
MNKLVNKIMKLEYKLEDLNQQLENIDYEMFTLFDKKDESKISIQSYKLSMKHYIKMRNKIVDEINNVQSKIDIINKEIDDEEDKKYYHNMVDEYYESIPLNCHFDNFPEY